MEANQTNKFKSGIVRTPSFHGMKCMPVEVMSCTPLKKSRLRKQVRPSVSPSADLDLKLQPAYLTTVSCVQSHVRYSMCLSEKGLSDIRGQSASSSKADVIHIQCSS